MSCDTMRELISAHVDGELDQPHRRDVAVHIESCHECRQMMRDYEKLRSHLLSGAKVKASKELTSRIRAALAREVADEASHKPRPAFSNVVWRQVAAVLLLCVASAIIGWVGGVRMAETNHIHRDIVASHMRALIQETPIQIASNNTHNVKPWFAGRVEFSPAVKDLSAAGFELVGGRLDYIGERRVGVVVYKFRQHWIDVYAWAPSSAAPAAMASIKGYNLVSWTQGGLVYWAISDLNGEELGKLKDLL